MSARSAITSSLTLALAFVLALAGAVRAQDPETLPRRLRDATSKATEALAARYAKLSEAHSGAVPAIGPQPPGAATAEMRPIVALTLLRAGGPAEHALAEKILDSWWADAESGKVALESSSNYQLALAISALEGTALARVDDGALTTRSRYEATPLSPTNQRRLEIATRALVEGRSLTGQEQTGCAWTYHMAPFRSSPAGTTVEREGGEHLRTFDNSNTQFSVLALHDAARAGVKVGKEIAEAIATHFLECGAKVPPNATEPRRRPRPTERETGRRDQPRDPENNLALRWGYTYCGRFPSTTMSLAGMSSLVVARELGARRERVDEALKLALVGIEDLAGSVSGADGYTLYSFEKALDLLEIDKVGGRDWFEPLAEALLAQRTPAGLWRGGTEDCFITLFLARATVSQSRVVDRRSTGAGAPSTYGEVFLSSKKKSVDAIGLVDAYAEAVGAPSGPAHEAAGEAVQALIAEGHGHDACLYPPLARLIAKGGTKRDAGASWLREINGRELLLADSTAAGERFAQLAKARDAHATAALRAAIGDPTLPLALRAFVATSLGEIACSEATPEVTAALERLAGDEKLLDTGAGARTARAIADALVGLARVPLPALEPKGPLAPSALVAVVEAVRTGERRVLDDSLDRAIAAFGARDKDPDAWKRARADVSARGRPALARLLELATGPRSAPSYEVMRSITGELIPDDAGAWRAYLESK